MAFPPERPLADPLLQTDVGPRDHSGAPVRAPIGNSIRTLLLLGLLVIAGVAIWWVGRPTDLTERIGGREWVIVDVDGEPATNHIGTASTFVLDGTHEIRGMTDCNTVTGRWMFDTSSQTIDVDWQRATLVGCTGSPTTYSIDTGRVRLSGGVMNIDRDDGTVRSISLADLAVVSADDLAGEWSSGSATIELGQRGLLRVDDCAGEWNATDDGISVVFDDPTACELASIWTTGEVIMPVRFEDSLYLHRAAASYPLDWDVHRLDLVDAPPRLDRP